MTDLVLLLALAVAGWLWFDGNRAREIACAAGRSRCAQAQVQFLDDTVERTRLGLRRNEQGRLMIWREYAFEFTRLGERRHRGRIELSGITVLHVELEPFAA